MSGELSPKAGESTDDFKARIEAKIADKKASQPVITPAPMLPDAAKAETKPEVAAATAQAPAPVVPPAPPQGAQPAQPQSTSPKGEQVDLRDWAQKKGIKDEESALRALRQLEQEFHRRNQDKPKPQAPVVPQAETPQPGYQPYPQPPQWTPAPVMPPNYPPSYPPQVVPNRDQMLEQYATQYGMTKEDFQRVLDVASDVAEAKVRNVVGQLQGELGAIKRENGRNSELRRLMTDPNFSNPEVQFEMHRILEENPAAFNVEPAPYTWAFNESMKNLARKFLQGTYKPQDPTAQPPSRPPLTAGGGNGSSSVKGPSESEFTPEKFAASSLDDKRKLLSSIGARSL